MNKRIWLVAMVYLVFILSSIIYAEDGYTTDLIDNNLPDTISSDDTDIVDIIDIEKDEDNNITDKIEEVLSEEDIQTDQEESDDWDTLSENNKRIIWVSDTKKTDDSSLVADDAQTNQIEDDVLEDEAIVVYVATYLPYNDYDRDLVQDLTNEQQSILDLLR